MAVDVADRIFDNAVGDGLLVFVITADEQFCQDVDDIIVEKRLPDRKMFGKLQMNLVKVPFEAIRIFEADHRGWG